MALSPDEHAVPITIDTNKIVQATVREGFEDCTKEQLKTVRELLRKRGGGPYSWMLPLLESVLVEKLRKYSPKRRRIRIDGPSSHSP